MTETEPTLGEDVEALRAELAETQARLKEAQGELARLVRLAEADLQRRRPGEQSSVVASSVRRPAAKEVAARIARFAHLYREAAAATPDRAPVVPEATMLEWLETSGLFDRQFYLACNDDVANAGADPTQHYYNHGSEEGRLPSPL
ncbi:MULTISPECIES: hypothetical protein [unclassified Methylobacterium]|uniref:hypothetical protein n=1 Tax=unclassified Methylobacterium TaxID=2615210 RepID=UPI0031452190